MATVAQGQSQLVNLGPNDAIKVSTPGEAYVDHLSGTPESPYASARLIKNTEPKVFGPYGANAKLRVRASEGAASIESFSSPQPAMVEAVVGGTQIGGKNVTKRRQLSAGIQVARGSSLNPTSATIKTVDNEQAILGPAQGGRFLFLNYDSANTMPVTRAKVTHSPRHGYNGALGPLGNDPLHDWTALAFAGSASVIVPAATASHSIDLNIPGAAISDRFSAPTIPRDDAASGPYRDLPLYRIRALITPNPTIALPQYAANDIWNAAANQAYHGGLVYANKNTAGDLVSTTADTQGVYDNLGGDRLGVFIPDYIDPVISVAMVGDSNTQGQGTLANMFAFSQQSPVKFKAKTGMNLSPMNFGASGQRHQHSMGVARAVVALYAPDYCVLFAQSPNGQAGVVPTTQALFDAMFADFYDTLQYLESRGVTPIAATYPMYGGGNLALIQAANAKLRRMNGSVRILDVYNILSPNGVLNGSPDGTHWTTTMHGFVADELARVIAMDY